MQHFQLKKRQVLILVFASLILFTECRDKKVAGIENAQKKELWTCSMHPQIIRNKPGNCPICGMDLIKKGDDAKIIRDIHLNNLLLSADQFVISSLAVTTIKKTAEAIATQAFGTISYDNRLVNTISARVSGRIEKLYVHYRYQHVQKGQRIMDVYSPELVTTQQELLFLLKNDPGNLPLLQAARQKLLLAGMSQGQLQQIIRTQKASATVAVYSSYDGHIHEAGNSMPVTNSNEQTSGISGLNEELPIKEGMYIEKGQTIFQVFNTSKSWVLLSIFPEYEGLIKTGDAVKIEAETFPVKSFAAKIDFIEPLFRKGNKTVTARVYFNNAQLQLPIGSQVKATIFMNTKQADWLPEDAVLSLGMDKVVFLKSEGGFIAHKVETGLTYKKQVQIVSGLLATDSVAANAQFLTDSESFIKIK